MPINIENCTFEYLFLNNVHSFISTKHKMSLSSVFPFSKDYYYYFLFQSVHGIITHMIDFHLPIMPIPQLISYFI